MRRSMANSSIEAKELAPERTPQTAMKRTMIRGCLRVRSTRGSLRSGSGRGRGRSVVGHWVLLSEGDRGVTRPIPCTDEAFANLLEFAILMREPWGRQAVIPPKKNRKEPG